MYEVFGPKWHPQFHNSFTFEMKMMEMQFLRRVRGIWSKMASRNPQKGTWIHIFGPGRSKTSPAGPPGQPGRQCRPVGLAGRRASLAAHGPAGCDLQVLQLAVDSGRGGEGGGRADNSPAPPLLSPQVGYLVRNFTTNTLWRRPGQFLPGNIN